MPRLRNELTGAVMTVTEATVARLGREWVDAEKSARSDSPDSTWKVAELKAYADENGIDLDGATKKDDVLAVITANAKTEDNTDSE